MKKRVLSPKQILKSVCIGILLGLVICSIYQYYQPRLSPEEGEGELICHTETYNLCDISTLDDCESNGCTWNNPPECINEEGSPCEEGGGYCTGDRQVENEVCEAVVQAPEEDPQTEQTCTESSECDDGDVCTDDVCGDTGCTFTPVESTPANYDVCPSLRVECGDGAVQTGEECDDGNTESNDGCSNSCTNEICGDAVIQDGLGEECDDGAENGDTGSCSSSCTINKCEDPELSINACFVEMPDKTILEQITEYLKDLGTVELGKGWQIVINGKCVKAQCSF